MLLPTLVLTAQKADAHPLDFIFNNTNNWEEDVLAKDVILSNQSSQVNFYGDANNCLFDIKAVFKDGSDLEDYRINLCEVSEASL